MNSTFQELVDAHLAGQLEHLVLTPTVRSALRSLGIPIPASQRETIKLPLALRDKIHVAPIPQNTRPSLRPGRRTARAKALRWTCGNRDDVLYTDAEVYTGQAAVAVNGIDSVFDIVATASLRTTQQEVRTVGEPRSLPHEEPSSPRKTDYVWEPHTALNIDKFESVQRLTTPYPGNN
ncbi:hypothetical protein HPB47_014968 [Ixodes persulcatus]|uniref:Uncharacterized protein n=1 Tax=Ixodes persulcatus TaxID=34615 RepID=A0AC60QVW6_IXOPE|nr:hypothetical protein HPB47_014968 [Ixodes persulcatus]